MYVMIKEDGVRVRITGLYFKVPHKKLLHIASRATYALLQLAPLTSFILFHQQTLKPQVRSFSENARKKNFRIHMF